MDAAFSLVRVWLDELRRRIRIAFGSGGTPAKADRRIRKQRNGNPAHTRVISGCGARGETCPRERLWEGQPGIGRSSHCVNFVWPWLDLQTIYSHGDHVAS